MRRSSASPLRRNPRGGFVLAVVMVGLTVVSAMTICWAKTAVMEHRALRTQQRQLQAEWLAASAIDRAAASLLANPKYTGETWQITAGDLGPRASGSAVIRVENVADSPNRRKILVQAEHHGSDTIRVSREAVIDLPPQTAEPAASDPLPPETPPAETPPNNDEGATP